MNRIFQGGRLVIASHNSGKVREIIELLAPFGVEIISASHLSLPEPEETGKTFLENACIKAHSAAQISKFPALADDSGLEVAALGGKPGVFSARWGGAGGDFSGAMEKVERALSGHEDRSARFVCVLALCWPDGHQETFEGFVRGHISWPPRGTYGFGYDPIFIPDGYDVTFGEMEPKNKHAISHRADAFNKLVKACFER